MKKYKIYEEIRNLRQKLVAYGRLVFQPQPENKDYCAQLVQGVRGD